MTVAFTGLLALGGAAAPSFGILLELAAVPVGVALVKLWRRVPHQRAVITFLTLAPAVIALFAVGLEQTHL
jgi:hypothetical protein